MNLVNILTMNKTDQVLDLICRTNLTMGPQVESSLNGSLVSIARVCCCGPFLVIGATTSSLLFLFHHRKTNNNKVHIPTYIGDT